MSETLGIPNLWDDKYTLRVDLLLDWLQPWSSTQYSLGVLGIRIPDVEPKNVGKNYCMKPLAIIPGPKAPNTIRPYLLRTLERFKTYLTERLEVSVPIANEPSLQPAQPHEQNPHLSKVLLRPLLTGFIADTPARHKVMRTLGANAYLGCSWCVFNGSLYPHNGVSGPGTIYYKGYYNAVPQTKAKFPRGIGQNRAMRVRDPRLRLTDAQQMDRAVQVEMSSMQDQRRDRKEPSSYGTHGVSVIPEILEYTSYNNLFVVPVAHSLLYGVIDNFVAHLLRPLPKEDRNLRQSDLGHDIISAENRAIMKKRAQHVRVTSDFGRRYKCLILYRKSYKIEDWLHFVEVFSAYIFNDILPVQAKRLWGMLCDAVSHYMRPVDEDLFHTQVAFNEGVRLAGDSLMNYARTLEQLSYPPHLFTSNLHMDVCRLPEQEHARGASCLDVELVVERLMQEFKVGMGRHVCRNPDKVFVNNYLIGRALARMRVEHGLRTIEELLHTPEPTGAMYDTMRENCKLNGRGQVVTSASTLQDIQREAKKLVFNTGLEGWTRADVDVALSREARVKCCKYTGATCREDIVSIGTGSSERDNFWVQVQYDNDDTPHAGLVRMLVKITHPTVANTPPLRLAMCDLYKTTLHGRLMRTSGVACERFYAVHIELIQAKLVCFRPTAEIIHNRPMFFMPCTNLTKRRSRLFST